MVTQICSPCLRQVNRINTKPVDVLKDNTEINERSSKQTNIVGKVTYE